MIVVDLNLLLYAVNRDAPQHEPAKRFWEQCLSGDETVGLCWPVVLGFLRITTHPKILSQPLDSKTAIAIVDDWLKQKPVRLLEPTAQHWPVLKEMLGAAGTAGNLTADAELAALAIEYGARLFTADYDFGRFAGLRWDNPLEP